MNRQDIVNYLANGLTAREKRKGQLHKAFTDSFDAKGIYNEKVFNQKLKYIHLNRVSGKRQLLKDYSEYGHGSASVYETADDKYYEPFDYRLLSSFRHRGWLGHPDSYRDPVRQLPTVQEQDSVLPGMLNRQRMLNYSDSFATKQQSQQVCKPPHYPAHTIK